MSKGSSGEKRHAWCGCESKVFGQVELEDTETPEASRKVRQGPYHARSHVPEGGVWTWPYGPRVTLDFFPMAGELPQ